MRGSLNTKGMETRIETLLQRWPFIYLTWNHWQKLEQRIRPWVVSFSGNVTQILQRGLCSVQRNTVWSMCFVFIPQGQYCSCFSFVIVEHVHKCSTQLYPIAWWGTSGKSVVYWGKLCLSMFCFFSLPDISMKFFPPSFLWECVVPLAPVVPFKYNAEMYLQGKAGGKNTSDSVMSNNFSKLPICVTSKHWPIQSPGPGRL